MVLTARPLVGDFVASNAGFLPRWLTHNKSYTRFWSWSQSHSLPYIGLGLDLSLGFNLGLDSSLSLGPCKKSSLILILTC